MSDAVPIRTLLTTVFESISEVFLLCLAGYVLSRAGVTDKATQRKLNVINVSLFTPALLFSKVAFSLTPSKLKEMWIIPLGFVVVSSLSAFVAYVMSKLFKLKRSQRSFAICASMFQNSNSLPIALIQSLVIEVPGLKWGSNDTKDQMLGRALTYLVLYSTLGMMLRWSWGVKLLSQADDEAPDVETAPALRPASTITDQPVQSPGTLDTHPGARETDPFFTAARHMTQDEQDEARNPTRTFDNLRKSSATIQEEAASPSIPFTASSAHTMHPPGMSRQGTGTSHRSGRASSQAPQRRAPTRSDSGREFWGLPEAPRRQRIEVPEDLVENSSDDEDDDEPTGHLPRSLISSTSSNRLKELATKTTTRTKAILKSINSFMTVPMYAALLSIFIAMIPPLQRGLTKMKPIEQAIKGAGACSIPVTLVVLGAFFYTPPTPSTGPISLPPDESDSPHSDNSLGGYFERKLRLLTHRDKATNSAPAYPGENRTVFVAIISRMIIVPLLMLPVIAWLATYDLFRAAEDPVFILSAVLLVSSPPALTLAQITQAASGDAFERLISKTISWSYAVLTPPLTLVYVVIGLVFGRL